MEQPKPDNPAEPKEWTAVGFLDEFMRIHEMMKDRSFAFLLGAGASITSNIPDAGTLARRWVDELRRFNVKDTTTTSIEDWATVENLGIPDFSLDNVAAFYPRIYDKRFADRPDTGYAYLEDAMNSAEPNIGYSIMAKVLEKTRHKVVITTNFDNLVADALSIYTDTFPLVCGHESLTSFVRSRLRRPLVAKIHGDLLLAPKSDTDGTSKLDERWAKVLRTLLKDYTPVVIGYGGNDGSLMDFLKELEPGQIEGGIYWCYHQASGRPEHRICDLVAKHKGRLVPVVGFDEFMMQLGERLEYPRLVKEVERRTRERVKRYDDQWKQFQKRLAETAKDAGTEDVVKPVREAFAAMVGREGSWLSWELKARAEADPAMQEKIYRQGLKQFPQSAELTGSFAQLLHVARKNHDETERLYRRALELDPDNVINTGNFAMFMEDVRKDYDEAERFYKRALELDSDQAVYTGSFAIFMADVRKNYDEAEWLYGRAMELDPDDARHTGNFAGLLVGQRRLDEAKERARQALVLNKGEVCQIAADVLLYWCLIARIEGRNDSPGIARLKSVLEKGFLRQGSSFAQVLEVAKEEITSEDFDFYAALAEAILDAEKVSELDRFERWKQIDPISLDEPWDMSGD